MVTQLARNFYSITTPAIKGLAVLKDYDRSANQPVKADNLKLISRFGDVRWFMAVIKGTSE